MWRSGSFPMNQSAKFQIIPDEEQSGTWRSAMVVGSDEVAMDGLELMECGDWVGGRGGLDSGPMPVYNVAT